MNGPEIDGADRQWCECRLESSDWQIGEGPQNHLPGEAQTEAGHCENQRRTRRLGGQRERGTARQEHPARGYQLDQRASEDCAARAAKDTDEVSDETDA